MKHPLMVRPYCLVSQLFLEEVGILESELTSIDSYASSQDGEEMKSFTMPHKLWELLKTLGHKYLGAQLAAKPK